MNIFLVFVYTLVLALELPTTWYWSLYIQPLAVPLVDQLAEIEFAVVSTLVIFTELAAASAEGEFKNPRSITATRYLANWALLSIEKPYRPIKFRSTRHHKLAPLSKLIYFYR